MEPFKNNFSKALVICIADHLEKHLKAFKRSEFEKVIIPKLKKLELKERSQLIADTLHSVLPSDHNLRYPILLAMLHPHDGSESESESDEGQSDSSLSNEEGLRGWAMMPLCSVVGQYGVEHFEESLNLLKEMTKRFTAEFDIRYFLLADQKRALKLIKGWVKDESQHVRRLVSEGTRPRLPWAMHLPQLIKDPSPVMPLLESLRDDDEEYVRRSVANHLNDISKDHPDLIADLAKKWLKGGDKNRERLLRHACRSLIKQGHEKTLKVFGYGPPKIKLISLNIDTPEFTLGERLAFSVDIQSQSDKPQTLLIDYVLFLMKSNGKLAGKVFKWKQLTLQPKEKVRLQRSQAIKAVTTRKYYSGEQAVSLRINGKDYGYETFSLVVP